MRLKLVWLFLFIIFASNMVFAQATPDGPPPPDDDFNVFLMILATIFFSLMIGAAFAGSFIAASVLLLMGALAGFGIVSVSILAGIYKRSVTAGFKTFLYIVC